MDNATVKQQYPTCAKCGFRAWDDNGLARHISEQHPVTADSVTTTIAKECPLCFKTNTVRVHFEDYQRWQGGTFIQNAMPYLTPAEREILMTGICGPCWDTSFGPDDE